MVPCERKADSDEFMHGLVFDRSRVNGVSDRYMPLRIKMACQIRKNENIIFKKLVRNYENNQFFGRS